jgi:hypothetical protein
LVEDLSKEGGARRGGRREVGGVQQKGMDWKGEKGGGKKARGAKMRERERERESGAREKELNKGNCEVKEACVRKMGVREWERDCEWQRDWDWERGAEGECSSPEVQAPASSSRCVLLCSLCSVLSSPS